MLSDVLQDLLEEGVELLGEHLVLVLSAMLIASAIAIPAGVLLTAHPRGRRTALAIASIGRNDPQSGAVRVSDPDSVHQGHRTAHSDRRVGSLRAAAEFCCNTVTGILGVDADRCAIRRWLWG